LLFLLLLFLLLLLLLLLLLFLLLGARPHRREEAVHSGGEGPGRADRGPATAAPRHLRGKIHL
jgi:hypothetical protein